jgi:hypothetical protein
MAVEFDLGCTKLTNAQVSSDRGAVLHLNLAVLEGKQHFRRRTIFIFAKVRHDI